ncbi:cation:proton antiporter [Haloarcula onubensis]|uniref:Sodium:proton antiporter n=1 Tax=Haloarcula onubensis TaxID=2950539 RepID=A0ABU2FSJ4_9EURY|nr:sodium:proton antiporter [Halomicroarcula sp. S3CR25-11]MDS0283222.1 sodium:proton antiporter [Halomicroarcula sp. S3CR25-11]
MEFTGVEAVLLDLVVLFALAGTIAAFAAASARIPYTIALVIVGLAVSLLGLEFQSGLTTELLSELILMVLVPALLFQGASRVNIDEFAENVGPILGLAVVGLLASVALLGAVGHLALGFPLLLSLLFATIVLPTDPVAVLPLFEELGAPERLSILVDGESMLNDGVGVVLYTSFIDVVLREQALGEPTGFGPQPVAFLATLATDIAVAMGGGILVGAVSGYVVYRVIAAFDDELTTVILSFVLAYGAFLIGETLATSGVVAVVSAGLFIAERREDSPLGADTRLTFRVTWQSAAFIGNTFLFLTIGLVTPFGVLVDEAAPIAVAIVLVFLARAVVVYPLTGLLNRGPIDPIPLSYQHVLVWGGIHVSIPLALALGLPAAFPDRLAAQFQALTFGIATFTLIVQGLTMAPVLDRLGLTTKRGGNGGP